MVAVCSAAIGGLSLSRDVGGYAAVNRVSLLLYALILVAVFANAPLTNAADILFPV